MPTPLKSDSAFLAEVEDFLALYDSPTFPSLQACANGDVKPSLVSEAPTQGTVQSVNCSETTEGQAKKYQDKKKKKMSDHDAALKYELIKAKDRKRRRVYRERRRIEKETLHQQVGELSAEIAERQKNKNTEKLISSSAWEMVAKRQLQARLNAEAEQRRLSTAIESRAAMIQEFQRFVNNRLSNENDEGVVDNGFQQKRIRLEPTDAEFYEAYLRELDTIYARTDETLTKYGLDSTDAVWIDPTQKWKEDGKKGYYIFLDKEIVPVDLQETGEKLWQVGCLIHRQEDRQSYDGVNDPDNTVAFKFRNTTRLNSGRIVSVVQRVAARRYQDGDRIVVVWRSFKEGEGLFAGMHADEIGWCVITPSTTKSETLMRTCMQHVPMHFSKSSTHEPAVQEFTGLALDTVTEDAAEITNALEKLILKDE